MKDRCELLPVLFTGYRWNLNGYARKLPFCGNGNLTMSEAIRVFQITPEPSLSDPNECVREAIRQKDLAWFSFFLHHYERRLNGQILRFFARNNMDRNDAERFLDYKLECMQMLLYGLAKYDPEQNADFPKYAAHYIRDGLLFSRVLEEAGSFSSLAEYRRVRQIGAIYNECNKNKAETVSRFTEKAGYNKTSETADELLTVAQLNRNIVPLYCTRQDEDSEETGEDVTCDDRWDYAEILWNGIRAEKIQKAFDRLDYREQTILEKRLAICMTCGRVGAWENRATFEELAVMFEGSTAGGAERSYKKAIEHLTEHLVSAGVLHAVCIKRKSKISRKGKVIAVTYAYRVDFDGEWGEIKMDFQKDEATIIQLAELDTVKTNRFARRAIAYLQKCEKEGEVLPRETLIPFEA